jgi:hypothetical protein
MARHHGMKAILARFAHRRRGCFAAAQFPQKPHTFQIPRRGARLWVPHPRRVFVVAARVGSSAFISVAVVRAIIAARPAAGIDEAE